MIAARMGHIATLLKNGKVLLAGGTEVNGTALGDLFDPATATFSPTATGGTQALWLAAALLQDGRVLLAGGELTTLISGPPDTSSVRIPSPWQSCLELATKVSSQLQTCLAIAPFTLRRGWAMEKC